MKTILQGIIFLCAVILIILCFVQSNRGTDVLFGLTNTGSELFNKTKDSGVDKKIKYIIWVLMITIFLLSLIEASI